MVDDVQARRRGLSDLPGVPAYGSAAVGAGGRRHDGRRGVHLRVALVRLAQDAYLGRGVELVARRKGRRVELAARRKGQPYEPHAALTRRSSAIIGLSLLMMGLALVIFLVVELTGRMPDIEKIKTRQETPDRQQPQP